MKRLLYALLCVLLTVEAFSQPTFVGPTITPFPFPKIADSAVYRPLKTSAYSYDSVQFRIGSSLVPQNLYVYSWNGENYFKGGIAWIRRDLTGAIVDTGWIMLPNRMQCINVGIVQDVSFNTYVIASYLDDGTTGVRAGVWYATYQWGVGGLTFTPASFPLTSDTIGGQRVSMDCYDLKKVVFTWEQAVDTSGGDNDWGGIHTRAISITSSLAPFNTELGPDNLVEATDTFGRVPDVAIGYSGDSVHIAYIYVNPPYTGAKPIVVRKCHFNDIRFGTGLVSMTLEDSIDAATTIYNYPGFTDRYDDFHINIDCPDHYTSRDVWSMIYNADTSDIYAETKNTSGVIVNKYLSDYLYTANRWPAVVWNNTATRINYGWYSRRAGGYVSNKLQSDGNTFDVSTPLGTYKVIDYLTNFWYKKMSFSKQNDRTRQMFLVYPYLQSGSGDYYDMRTKLAGWNATAFRPAPTAVEDITEDLYQIDVVPNPFAESFILFSNAPPLETFDVLLTDLQGKQLHKCSGTLSDVNTSLRSACNQLAGGLYFVNTRSKSGNYDKMIKVVKN